jgi:hypothetical protein
MISVEDPPSAGLTSREFAALRPPALTVKLTTVSSSRESLIEVVPFAVNTLSDSVIAVASLPLR